MIKSLSQIIESAEAQKTPEAQAKILMNNSSKALKDCIGYAMDPNVKWLLPSSDPPYRPMPESADQEGRLYNETRRLIYFVDSPDGRALTNIRREQIFIQLLESIDLNDAKLMLRIKNHSLTLDMKAVKIAFPNLAKNW